MFEVLPAPTEDAVVLRPLQPAAGAVCQRVERSNLAGLARVERKDRPREIGRLAVWPKFPERGLGPRLAAKAEAPAPRGLPVRLAGNLGKKHRGLLRPTRPAGTEPSGPITPTHPDLASQGGIGV